MAGEDLLAATASLSNGALMSIESSYISCGWSVELYGTNGYIIYDRLGISAAFGAPFHGAFLKIDESLLWQELPLSTIYSEQEQDPSHEYHQIRRFICSVLTEGPPPYSAEEGYHDLRVIHAIYQSSKLGRRVVL